MRSVHLVFLGTLALAVACSQTREQPLTASAPRADDATAPSGASTQIMKERAIFAAG